MPGAQTGEPLCGLLPRAGSAADRRQESRKVGALAPGPGRALVGVPLSWTGQTGAEGD